GSYLVVLIQLNQTDTLGRPAHSSNIGRPDANQLPVGSHHENVGVLIDRHDGNNLAVLVCRPNIDDALATSALCAVFLNARSFAEPALRDRQDLFFFGGTRDHRDNIVLFIESDSDNAIRLPAHFTNIGVMESDAHSIMGSDKHGFISGDQFGWGQLLVL